MTTREIELRDKITKLTRVKICIMGISIIAVFFLSRGIYLQDISHMPLFKPEWEMTSMIITIMAFVALSVLLFIRLSEVIDYKINVIRMELDSIRQDWINEVDNKLMNTSLTGAELVKLYPGKCERQEKEILERINTSNDRNSLVVFIELFKRNNYPQVFFEELKVVATASEMSGIERALKLTCKGVREKGYMNERAMVKEFIRGSIKIMQPIELIKLTLSEDILDSFEEFERDCMINDMIARINESDLPLCKIAKTITPYYSEIIWRDKKREKLYNYAEELVLEKFTMDLGLLKSEDEFNRILVELRSGRMKWRVEIAKNKFLGIVEEE